MGQSSVFNDIGRPLAAVKDGRGCDLVCGKTFSNVSAELGALRLATFFPTFIYYIYQKHPSSGKTHFLIDVINPYSCNNLKFSYNT